MSPGLPRVKQRKMAVQRGELGRIDRAHEASGRICGNAVPFGEGHDPVRIEPLRARIVFLTANLSGTGQARAEQDSVLRGGVAVIAITLAAGDNGRRGGGLGQNF